MYDEVITYCIVYKIFYIAPSTSLDYSYNRLLQSSQDKLHGYPHKRIDCKNKDILQR